MTVSGSYAEIRSWQQGIAALIGFSGLITAALWNFHLNRRRDRELASSEVRSLATALYSEMTSIRKELAAFAEEVAIRFGGQDEFDQFFLDQWELPQPIVYRNILLNIGKLPVRVIQGVNHFYACLEESRKWTARLLNEPDRNRHFATLFVLRPAVDAVEQAVETLAALRKDALISDNINDLDTSEALTVIMQEEDRRSAMRAGE